VKWLIGVCVVAATVVGAPILRLSNSVVVAQTAAGVQATAQGLQAINAGDGMLSLTAAATPYVPWLGVAIGPGNVIQFTFAALPAGTYTASVTVSDPNAIDSPQVVIVTLQSGPAPIVEYLSPGTRSVVPLAYECLFCSTRVSTNDGGGWLTVSYSSMGTLLYPQSVVLSPPAGMATGTYSGTVAVTGNINQTIPVTMNVTTLPIAVPSTQQLFQKAAQNGPAATYPFVPAISLTNSGLGTLQVNGVSGSGTGVTASNYNGIAIVTVDPTGLATGTYTDGLVTIQCNGANCPVKVPVTLEVDAQGAPVVNYQGAVDNATFSPTGSPGDVMVVKGTQLSLEAPQTASVSPLPTSLGGASVLVNGVATPLYYSSFGQIAFQARADTYLGTALVQVVRGGQSGNTVSVTMAQYAPGIVVVTDTAYNVVDANHPIKTGSTLIFWVLGLGATSPVVGDGTAAPVSPLAEVTAPVTVQFGLEFFQNTTTPSFVGLSPGSVGLYQVTATLPSSTPVGTASAWVLVAGVKSNLVSIAVN
jgi:uncharacterized protein (TIGR03437 family)